MRLAVLLPPATDLFFVGEAIAIALDGHQFQLTQVMRARLVCEICAGGNYFTCELDGHLGGRQVTLLATDENLCVAQRLVHRFGGVGCLEHEGKLHTFRKKPVKNLRPITAITRKDLAEARRIFKKLT